MEGPQGRSRLCALRLALCKPQRKRIRKCRDWSVEKSRVRGKATTNLATLVIFRAKSQDGRSKVALAKVTDEDVRPHLPGRLAFSRCHKSAVQTQLQAPAPDGSPEAPAL